MSTRSPRNRNMTDDQQDNQENPTETTACNPTDIYLREIGASPLLTKEEEIYYSRLALQGDLSARHHMITSNLRLVVKIARRYIRSGMPILDLIAEGNIGLMRAVEKFNPELGFRFSTYGAWWIQQTIERAIMNQNRTIRLPIHVMKKVNQCLRAKKILSKNLNYEPTVEQIAHSSGSDLPAVKKLMLLNEKMISIDNRISNEIQKPILELIPGHEKDDPLIHLMHAKLQHKLAFWLSHLHPKQRSVVERRYGLNGHEEMTLHNTGNSVGLTKERVRQLQSEALQSLKTIIKQQGNDLNTLLN